MNRSRLDSRDAELAEAIRRSSDSDKHKLAVDAIELALKYRQDTEAVAITSFQKIQGGGELSNEEIRVLTELQDSHDNKYFDLQESGASEDQYFDSFSHARLISAIILLNEQNVADGAAEVIYECSAVFGNPQELTEAIMKRTKE